MEDLEVHYKGTQFHLSSNGNSFDVNISWDEPTFNRKLTGYQFSYQVGYQKSVVNETVSTSNYFFFCCSIKTVPEINIV